ncbi:dihydroorotase [bacterium]|nr:dihydroorotase [bacterium]QQR58447.1 MAG: dihydroorotase [Candidatus Melainabacteria bacterium]
MRIRKIDDMHVHLRQGEMLESVLPYTAMQCERALVMPNLTPPILNANDVINYRQQIMEVLSKSKGKFFAPLMTFKIVPSTSAAEIDGLKQAGTIAGKLYPDGVTTNSEGGVSDFKALYPVYKAMEESGLVLCLHGEMPHAFSLDREFEFLSVLKDIALNFPKLRIVLEHATTKDAIDCVKALPVNVACSLTVHHMYLTLDDIIGDRLNPHAFCKPVAKRPTDRLAIIDAALSGNPKFFLGSDSAPHAISAKENACGAAGVYTAPVLVPALCQIFEDYGTISKLEAFTSQFAAEFYNLPLNQHSIEIAKEPWTVPDTCGEVKPFLAGQTLNWQVKP